MKPFRERHRGGGVILNEVKNLVIEGSEILRRCLIYESFVKMAVNFESVLGQCY
jgi:hypothetical protein